MWNTSEERHCGQRPASFSEQAQVEEALKHQYKRCTRPPVPHRFLHLRSALSINFTLVRKMLNFEEITSKSLQAL